MVKPIINSEKRIRQVSLTNVSPLGVGREFIAEVKRDPNLSDPTEIAVGTVIKAVYIELWLLATSQQPNTSVVAFLKATNGSDGPIPSEMLNLNAYGGKKNIFEMHQGLTGDANTNSSPFFRGWVKVPKGKQRFGLGDNLQIAITPITEDIQYCGVFIFKAYN